MTLAEKIQNLEQIINCKFIYLTGLFTGETLNRIENIIISNSSFGLGGFLIVINSRGGNNVYDNNMSIREFLNKHLNGKQLWVLINKEIASTATVLSFSVDKLFYLNADCKIGPIDPQIRPGEPLFTKETEFLLNWEKTEVSMSNINNEEGIKTIEASMRSFKIGSIINKIHLDVAFRYLININNDFRSHSDRKGISELPLCIKKSIIDITTIVRKELIENILEDLDSLKYKSDFLIYSI